MAGLPGNRSESCANALLGDHVRLLLDQREDQLGMGLMRPDLRSPPSGFGLKSPFAAAVYDAT